MHCIDQFLARKGVNPGLVGSPTGTHFRDNDQPIRIRMERLLDDLIGHMRAVEVARIDVIHTDFNGLLAKP